MSFILDITTAVPGYCVKKEDILGFYSRAVDSRDTNSFLQKLNFLCGKTRIEKRYSCIPDFSDSTRELFTDGGYSQPVEKRMDLYKKKIVPLASGAIDLVFANTKMKPGDVTHLITVSCTGLMAPGLEFLISERYGLQHTEKIGLNFLGCYAAMKALKYAHYIAGSNPKACILIVCAELCSLHFYPSEIDEDIIANLLFADGASAVMMCGDKSEHAKNKIVLKMDDAGSAYIPGTFELMTWNISSSAFRMYLSKQIVNTIKKHIRAIVSDFLVETKTEVDYWAIHPGGVKIIEAVQQELELKESNVEDSMKIMQQYGNMSSPTILFILSSIFAKIKSSRALENKKIFSCAFGPGLNVEMISFSSVNTNFITTPNAITIHQTVQA